MTNMTSQIFQQQRGRALKCWLILLVFNIFLQFDFAETGFNKFVSQNTTVNQQNYNCANSAHLLATSEKDQFEFSLLASSLGISNEHSLKIFAHGGNENIILKEDTSPTTKGSPQVASKQPERLLTSGLSPPIFS
jgi:hypothetical protein